jgi:hypothetical protein
MGEDNDIAETLAVWNEVVQLLFLCDFHGAIP